MWIDGICNKCGFPIVEFGSRHINAPEEYKHVNYSDYVNKCTNMACEHSSYHFIGDMDELDYYQHLRPENRDAVYDAFKNNFNKGLFDTILYDFIMRADKFEKLLKHIMGE